MPRPTGGEQMREFLVKWIPIVRVASLLFAWMTTVARAI
jgi:hypothetical protein